MKGLVGFALFAALGGMFFACSSDNGTSSNSDNISSSSWNVVVGSMTDPRDNQSYKTTTIGKLTWMSENLNYNYNEGTAASYCYGDMDFLCDTYGRLYSWSAAMDSAAIFSDASKNCGFGVECSAKEPVRGVCPEGWHLPSLDEYVALIKFVDDSFWFNNGDDAYSTTAGTYLKSTTGWDHRTSNGYHDCCYGSDAVSFAALPAGYHGGIGDVFNFKGEGAFFWSSTEFSKFYSYSMYMYDTTAYAFLNWRDKDDAKSVRCLKDAE